MSIVFDWLNPNESELTKIEVYRADKRGGTKTLLATVEPTALAYEDTTAEANKVYWYSTVAYMGDENTASVENPLASFESTGPGSQTLLRGDWGFGYFGEVQLSELPTFAEIGSKTGFGTSSASTTANKRLHKFVANGKIIFVPMCPLTTSTFSVNSLTTAKVCPRADQPDSELLQMSKGNFTYTIRVPFATDEGSATPTGSMAFQSGNRLISWPDSFLTSEVAALFSVFWGSNAGWNPVTGFVPGTSLLPNMPKMVDEELLGVANWGDYFWTGTPLKVGDDIVSNQIMVRAYDFYLMYQYPKNYGRLFWPVYVLNTDV